MPEVMLLLHLNGWTAPFSLLLLLLWASYVPARSQAKDVVPQEHFNRLQASKASLVYFQRDTSPPAGIFLEQLENSIEALRDYGISVLKVNCHSGKASSYCREGGSLGKAHLFRGQVLLRELPTDALFSVDAIVANVLFALLFNEVKYVATLVDLQKVEDALKGQSDLVFAYVQAVGTAEHRALMEAAFVYTSVKFALTTEVTLLRSIRREPDVPSSKLFYCHCKVAEDAAQPCRRTLMDQPLATLNIHKFLKLMEEPLVVEATEDPEKVSTTHLRLGLPLIFILTHKETFGEDKRIAEFVAWKLLGKAGVLLLSRSSVGLDIHPRFNVALKTPEEGVPVKYLVLKDMDEIIALVESGKQSEAIQGYEEGEEHEEEEEEDGEKYEQEIQDDQVVESVVRDRKHELPLEHIQTLTEESFAPALAETNATVVLFYASWEAVSLVVMQSYVEVAALLQGTPEVALARVNCWDWPQICTQQNVTQFPTIKMYAKGGRRLVYSGMWGTQEILRFIELSRMSCPVRLTTPEEVEEYFRVKISPYHRVLGLFDPSMGEAREAFVEAGKVLDGYVTTGIYYEEDAAILSHNYKVPLPALLLAKPEAQTRRVIKLSKYSVQDIVEVIRHALLETFPEITVGNLPEYFQLEKPLLVLFSDGALSKRDEGEMQHLAREERRPDFVACWLNLKNTPVGRGILTAYFGSFRSPLPLLLWISLHSGGQVFVFPSDQPISEVNVLAWIEKLKSGQEVPSTVLSDEEWKPRLPAYDFLSMMKPPLPEFTIYSRGSVSTYQEEANEVPGEKTAGVVREEPVEDSRMAELEKKPPTGGDLRGTAPRLAAKERQAKRHAEL
ncbi:thioredoxin domain-containing protein 16 isoform X2 [Rhineura floridana]|uniref:thioredoxin domain-containing protein 16 isoform X2 n=1 Tax=Rhineura floridana TaxID=261503 RepID=UPI002AC81995|nr:thioredoxin domain-containing protein 16 isoform X2 [Rhineura floridana]